MRELVACLARGIVSVDNDHDDGDWRAAVARYRRRYYVSAVDGRRTALLVGPFTSHAAALARVDAARAFAMENCGMDAGFAAYGTLGAIPKAGVCPRAGKFNDAFGLSPAGVR